ncbi:hypothetical protein L596_005955 [Steinernema carpocapsae]|uniref:Uncharacterized protein n=1 Tax=Steinernema carpocapsae TaxID=34508 RepID=A0A4U8V0N5_STECR|nr:hypothetical protein L596_005955 [Steinernema carpocapsae]
MNIDGRRMFMLVCIMKTDPVFVQEEYLKFLEEREKNPKDPEVIRKAKFTNLYISDRDRCLSTFLKLKTTD